MRSLNYAVTYRPIDPEAREEQAKRANNAGKDPANARDDEVRVKRNHPLERCRNDGNVGVHTPKSASERRQQTGCVSAGAHQQCADPLAAFREWYINIRVVCLVQK